MVVENFTNLSKRYKKTKVFSTFPKHVRNLTSWSLIPTDWRKSFNMKLAEMRRWVKEQEYFKNFSAELKVPKRRNNDERNFLHWPLTRSIEIQKTKQPRGLSIVLTHSYDGKPVRVELILIPQLILQKNIKFLLSLRVLKNMKTSLSKVCMYIEMID